MHVHKRELRKLRAASTSNLFVLIRLGALFGFLRCVGLDFDISRRRIQLRSESTRSVATGSAGLAQFVLSLFWSGDKSIPTRLGTA